MVATVVVPLVQVPPVRESVSVVVMPEQMEPKPEIALGLGFTVTLATEGAPQPLVNEMVAEPAPTPVTTPVEPTVATAVLLLVQVPGAEASDKESVPPGQNAKLVPVMGAAAPFTATTLVENPQAFE